MSRIRNGYVNGLASSVIGGFAAVAAFLWFIVASLDWIESGLTHLGTPLARATVPVAVLVVVSLVVAYCEGKEHSNESKD